jgi:HD-GYP domain-containing protein (c-di-GMP phosphodiesterase class II)
MMHGNMSACYLMFGDYRRGLVSAAKALSMLEGTFREGCALEMELCNYYAARLLMETGQFVEAGECLAATRCAQLSLYAPLIQLAEGMLMVYEGRLEVGLTAIDEAVEDQIRRAPYTTVMETMLAAARSYELAGRPEEARARIARAIDHSLTLRRRRMSSDFEQARRILDEGDADTIGLLADRGHRVWGVDTSDSTRRKLQNMAVIAELPEYPCARHAFRVAKLSYLLSRRIGQTEANAQRMSLAGFLHDIGKIGVPRQLLAKGFSLSEIELEAVRTHTTNGEDLLRNHDGDDYRVASTVARSHHERWDGRGYPDGLAGERIPLAPRIVALAEAFDAMTHERPWRKALPVVVALDRIRSEAAGQFDPALVGPFIECVEAIRTEEEDLESFLSEEAQDSDLVALQSRLDAALRATSA